MKFSAKRSALAVALAIAASSLSVGAAENEGVRASADVAWTDVETVTDYLTNTLSVAVSDVRVYASDEAVPLACSEEAAEAYKDAKLVVIPDDLHCYDYHLDMVEKAVQDFLLSLD